MSKKNRQWFDDLDHEDEDEHHNHDPLPELKNIEDLSEYELGELLFTEEQIIIIQNTTNNDFSSRVIRGQLITQAKMRQMVIAQAIGGSSEAQKIVNSWILKNKLDSI